MLTFGSLFDGCGCFTLGLSRAGWTPRWLCEIEADCRRVTAARFPGVRQYEDVRTLKGADVEPVDLLVGGFPCTDLSVAGRRAGLAGGQSGLWFEFARVIGEVRPRWVVIENVPGLVTSWSPVEPPPGSVEEGTEWEVEESSDLETVLADLGELRYWWAWRVLDAQYFGLAQRRERVFIVGRSGDGGGLAGQASGADARRLRGLPGQVLFEPESVPWHPAPCRETGQDVAPSVTPGARRASGNRAGEQLAFFQANGAGSFRTGSPTLAVSDDNGSNHVVVSGLQGHTHRAGYRLGADEVAGNQVVCVTGERSHAGRATGHDASEDGTGRGTPIVAFQCHGSNVGPASTLRQGNGGLTGGVPFIVNAAEQSVPFNIIGMAQQGRNHAYEAAVSGCLQHKGLCPTGNEAGTVVAFQESQSGMREGGIHATLDSHNGSRRHQGVSDGVMLRRLTPLECCRLQGLPDWWLDLAPPLADSAKYRQIGNGGAVPILEWIGRRIACVEASQ